jgi:hypothetical protein
MIRELERMEKTQKIFGFLMKEKIMKKLKILKISY